MGRSEIVWRRKVDRKEGWMSGVRLFAKGRLIGRRDGGNVDGKEGFREGVRLFAEGRLIGRRDGGKG